MSLKPKPVLFVSAVSKELHSARDLVGKTLYSLGYEPDWEDVFGTEEGGIPQMLARRIDESDGVVQLLGQCYGSEPPQPDPDFGRVSYTQYEALYARQRGKKVWYILLADTYPADPHDPEPDDQRRLQSAYRKRVLGDQHLDHSAANPAELANCIHGLKHELASLRRGFALWQKTVLVLLLIIAAGGAWGSFKLLESSRKQDKLLAAMRELAPTLAQDSQPGVRDDEQTRLARAYAMLEEKLKLPRGMLKKELPKFAEQLLQRSDTSLMDRASALFAANQFAKAEEAALGAKDKALATEQPVKDVIAALELAGSAAQKQEHYPRALEHYRAAAALTSQQRDPVEWARVQSDIYSASYWEGWYRASTRIYLAHGVSIKAMFLATRHAAGPEHPRTLTQQNDVANNLVDQGRFAEGEKEHRAVLAIRQRVLGPEHPDTLTSRRNLANSLHGVGKHAEDEAECRARIPIEERVLGPEHPETLTSRNNLAVALYAQAKYAEAEKEHRAVLAIRQRVLRLEPPDVSEHPSVFESCYNLALCLRSQERKAEALVLAQRALVGWLNTLGEEHPNTQNAKMLVERLEQAP